MAHGLRPHHRQGRRLHRHQRPGRDELRHLPRRRQDGLASRSSPSPGRSRTNVIGTDAFQETPIVEVCRAITKHHYLRHAHRGHRPRREGGVPHRHHRPARPGPHRHAARTCRTRPIVPDWDPPMNLPGYRPDPQGDARPNSNRCSPRSARARSRSSTPAAASSHSGRGRRAARSSPRTTGIPVALTVHGLGSFPADHYLCLHMLGMHGTVYSNYAINDADLLLALGVRFDDRVTGKLTEFAKHGKIVHIDIDPSRDQQEQVRRTSRSTATSKSALDRPERDAEARSRTPTSSAGGRYPDWLRQIDAWRDAEPLKFAEPRRRASCRSTPSTGCGRSCATATNWTTRSSRPASASTRCGRRSSSSSTSRGTWITSGGLGTMGFGLPGRDGRAGRRIPDKPGHRHRRRRQLPDERPGTGDRVHARRCRSKVLLLNNQHLGMVVQWEDRFFGGNRGHTYLGRRRRQAAVPGLRARSPRASACRPRSITDKADLDAALIEMIESDGAVPAERPRAAPGARAADDPRRHDREGHHQGVSRR